MIMTANDSFALPNGSVAAVIGCGGKTAFIELMARSLSDKKVLVTPTTKIFPMRKDNVILCETLQQCEQHKPGPGIQCLGLLNATSGKLEALPEHTLSGMIPRYDITLMEADGSRGLPCKGYLANEPVIPRFCTHTIGIVTMNALGKAAAHAVVHRLPEFLALTGLREGEAITAQTLEAMVCAPGGMFKNAAGQQFLLVNQTEDDASAHAALSFLQTIKTKFPQRFAKLLYGSVRHDAWQEV